MSTQVEYATSVYVEVDDDTGKVLAVRVQDEDLQPTGKAVDQLGEPVSDAARIARATAAATLYSEWPTWQFGFDS